MLATKLRVSCQLYTVYYQFESLQQFIKLKIKI